MTGLFLCIDVGNTRIKWALYEREKTHDKLVTSGAEFLENINTLFENHWMNLPRPDKMLGGCVASDAIARQVEHQMAEWGVDPNWIVPRKSEYGLTNHYDQPAIMGADRWVALVAAWHKQVEKCPLVVVLLGTATTIEAIGQNGSYLGGLIIPGHGIMLKALQTGTARLQVPTGNVKKFPTNASDGLTSGGTYAIVGAIDRMFANLAAHSQRVPKIIMTGGAAWKIADYMTNPFELCEDLIMEGILLMASKTCPQ